MRLSSSLLLMIIFVSCEDEPVDPEPIDPETPIYYWKATVDGVPVSYEVGVDDHIHAFIPFSDDFSDGDSIKLDPGAGISSPDYFDKGYGQIDFIGYQFLKSTYESDKAAALESMFTLGDKPFALTFTPDSPGINVRRDINNVQWMSLYDEQPLSSNFTVIESIASESFGGPTRIVKGTFNCIITSEDGATKTIEDGTFFLEFQAP